MTFMVSLQKRESTKVSTYDHESRLDIEWKVSLDSWPTNIEMDIETPTTKDKA